LKGHAIELRVIAEKIELDDENELRFIPDPGNVSEVFFLKKPMYVLFNPLIQVLLSHLIMTA
jgi:hypothetical protein